MQVTKKAVLAIIAASLVLGLGSTGRSTAHDLFLKLKSYFLQPDSRVTVSLINGTFERSENAIARDRMLDVSVVGPNDQVSRPATSQWRDENNAALLEFQTGPSGTYTIGVSTAPRIIELAADDFNTYLKHDGIVDTLKARTDADELDQDARERYSKHVKAIVQVGDSRTAGYDARLGYPVELVPLQNPYALKVGDALDVLFLKDGQPVTDHIVYASHEGFHGHDDAGDHVEAFSGRTDKKGIVRVDLNSAGRWYVRTIHMESVDEQEVDYESNWATLTFEIPKS